MTTPRYLDQPYLLAGRRIDPITGTLSYRDTQKHLRRKELEVLALLADHSHADCVPRSVFIQQLWPTNPIGGEQGLTDAISALRRALQDDRENPLILTIPRRGYQLRASVRVISRDGGVAFVAGTVIDGRPDWRLKQLLERTDAHESWLAEDGRSRRIFRFCRNELQLRKLRREIVLMRYLREALARCEYVSTILDWQLEEPPYFLELAAPACGNLRGVMLGKAVPEPHERWQLLHQVAEALAAVHAAGVVHRNLGPDSVLVDRRGNERVALLGEFGVAALDDRQRLAELGIDAEGISLKTALPGPATVYTAPECAAGAPASAASDVYALGVLIVQTLRGDFERLATGFEEFPAEIAPLLQRCCAADPAARPSAAEAAAQLHEWTQPRPVPRSPELMPEPVSQVPALSRSTETQAPNNVPLPLSVTEPGGAAPLTPVPLADQYIDRYRIVSEIAQGGMGVVYLAEQSEPVQRRVALKLIRAGLDSTQVLARFEAERQALAMMNHPNISAIFDAGTTPGGYPYFVMEYVPGKDIVRHCDDARLDLRARIRLFLQVCDGVLHAHQKGLIHRDLKPGNILVKQKSEQPALVKLIDFGVAKSLAGGPGAGVHTRLGGFIGTPVYSCPEQVTDPTRDIDTRADLYSLGVVLYELLTGVPPRSSKELDADTPAELARRLRNSKTPPMGSRFTCLSAEERQRIADFRAMSEQGLSMQLCSDLDWIVGKCIAQDPEDRYPTAQDLRLDLQRWLDDRPVEARPASAWYRFRKLVRRNRLNAALTATATLALISTTAAAVIGYSRAQSSALQAQQAAAFQADQIKAISPESMGQSFRNELLESVERALRKSDPASADEKLLQFSQFIDGIDFTGITTKQVDRHLLEPGLRLIEEKYTANPELQALLRQSSADTLVALGLYERSLIPQEQVIQWHLQQRGPRDPHTLDAQAKKGLILLGLDRTDDAVKQLDDTIAAMRASNSLNSSEAVTALIKRAHLYNMQGNYPSRRKMLNQALDIATTNFGPDDPRTLRVEYEMEVAAIRDSSLDDVARLVQRLKSAVGGDHPDTLGAMEVLASRQSEIGLHREALETSQAVLSARRRTLGEHHRDVAKAQSFLSRNLAAIERYDEAIDLMRVSIATTERVLGSNSTSAIFGRGNLGTLMLLSGKIAEPRSNLKAVVEMSESRFGERTPPHLIYSGYLAQVEYYSGELVDAMARSRYVAESLKKSRGRSDMIAESLERMAMIMLIEKRHQEAHDTLQEAMEALQANHPRDKRIRLRVQVLLAYTDHLLGKPILEQLQAHVSEQKADPGIMWLDIATSAAYLASVYNDLTQPESALETSRAALEDVSKIFPAGHFAMLPLLREKMRAAAAIKDQDAAIAAFQKSLQLIEHTPGLDPRWRNQLDQALAEN
jgi:serine/threonine protein kinase/DNA-binding winged helix-turn-helix (wHTH) protein